ncbi:hypothetical protein KSP24_07845 [Paenibacillus sp. AK121]|uniref:hypothetical protein n=1 Tax=Paenibacillus TaxID=44249 RepID=UPI001C24A22C|nr:hypothetical protein [Paenibacillus sp. AK121]MBU9706839.1 hypothetical protein [Paenibacillus sp. AK121]MEE4567124.1 hypothetical protein [Paenibacillus polymyxa]
MKLYEEILNSDSELVEALKYAAETEGVVKSIGYKRPDQYKKLERMGCVIFQRTGSGYGIVHLTTEGREYLEQLS